MEAVPAAPLTNEAFYEQRRPEAVRLAALLSQERCAAEDAAHEALTAVYRQWDRLDAPAAYLRTCVVNACAPTTASGHARKRGSPSSARAVRRVPPPGEKG